MLASNEGLNLGFMQGRLSPIIDEKIQSFPWETWERVSSLLDQIVDLKK